MTRVLLSALLVLMVAAILAAPVFAQSPDPVTPQGEGGAASVLRPILGVIVLGSPAVFMIWKSWRKKKIDTRAST